MALARGPAADYDEWAKLVGEDGWKWENILPLMREVGSLVKACWCSELTCCHSLRTLTRSYLRIYKRLLLHNLQTMVLQGRQGMPPFFFLEILC
jgi:choline dehydrogenase-like flavoprotein